MNIGFSSGNRTWILTDMNKWKSFEFFSSICFFVAEAKFALSTVKVRTDWPLLSRPNAVNVSVLPGFCQSSWWSFCQRRFVQMSFHFESSDLWFYGFKLRQKFSSVLLTRWPFTVCRSVFSSHTVLSDTHPLIAAAVESRLTIKCHWGGFRRKVFKVKCSCDLSDSLSTMLLWVKWLEPH